MKVNKFVFVDREESSRFQRIPTQKQFTTGVSPFAETMQIDAIDRSNPPEDLVSGTEGE